MYDTRINIGVQKYGLKRPFRPTNCVRIWELSEIQFVVIAVVVVIVCRFVCTLPRITCCCNIFVAFFCYQRNKSIKFIAFLFLWVPKLPLNRCRSSIFFWSVSSCSLHCKLLWKSTGLVYDVNMIGTQIVVISGMCPECIRCKLELVFACILQSSLNYILQWSICCIHYDLKTLLAWDFGRAFLWQAIWFLCEYESDQRWAPFLKYR